MAITPRPISVNYDNTVYDFVKHEEKLIRRIYSDPIGIPTLGVGYAMIIRTPPGSQLPYAIRPTLNADLAAIGITLSATDNNLLNTLLANLNAGNGAANFTLVDRAPGPYVNDEELSATSATLNDFSFSILNDQQARALYDISVARARTDMQARFAGHLANRGIPDASSEAAALFASLDQSHEMKTLTSLAFNSPGLIGPNLTAVLYYGDRAEAWYNIRYDSNKGGSHANRRYREAEQFSLYNDINNITDDDAKGAYRTFTRHAEDIRFYEGFYPPQLASDNTVQITAIQVQLEAARSWLTSNYIDLEGIDVTVDWDRIQVGEDSTWYKGTNADVLQGSDQNDLILGESGNDILQGNLGDDVLHGGTGVDIYKYRPGDGTDIIVDSDGKGLLLYDPDGQAQGLTVGLRQATDPEGQYKSPDGSVTYQLSGADLLITTPGGAITVKDFNKDTNDLGIRLVDLPTEPGDGLAPITNVQTNADNTQATVTGTAAAETTPGTGLDDIIYGNGGGDLLHGNAGDDRIEAGADNANARLDGEIGSDILVGGEGEDHLIGGPDDTSDTDDALQGGDGDDYLEGGGGNDFLGGGAGRDVLMGGAGHDVIHGASTYVANNHNWSIDYPDPVDQVIEYLEFSGDRFGSDGVGDIAYGGTGMDLIVGGRGDDVFFGEDDNDSLQGNTGNDHLFGGAGVDAISGGYGADSLFGGLGNDYLDGGGFSTSAGQEGDDYLDGGAGNDELFGNLGRDTLLGGAGTDLLLGEDDDDYLDGGDGDDAAPSGSVDGPLVGDTGGLLGGAGNDTIHGGAGNDNLFGGEGNDRLYGGADNDQLVGGAGADVLDGGTGNDTIFRDELDTVVFRPGDGNDQISSAPGGLLRIESITPEALAISNVAGSDGYQYLGLAFGADSIFIQGGFLAGDQTFEIGGATLTQRELMQYAPSLSVQGRDTDDTIYGGNQDDTLLGDRGNDILDGQGGNDWLEGGAGDDTYRFGRGYGVDQIWENDDTPGNRDTLRFLDGIGIDDLFVTRSGDDLVVGIEGTADKLVMQDWWYERYHLYRSRIERFELADGTAVDLTALIVSPPGTDGEDTLYGGSGADILFGRGGYRDDLFADAGNDVLAGGTGNDNLFGGAGSDVYLFNPGDGDDYIDDGFSPYPDDIDTLSLGAGIRPEDIDASLRESYGYSELILTVRSSGESIWSAWFQTDYFGYDNFLSTDDRRIERIQFMGNGADRVFDLRGLVDARWNELKASWDLGTSVALFTPETLQTFELTGQAGLAGGQSSVRYAATGEVYDLAGVVAPGLIQPIVDRTGEQYRPFFFQLPGDVFLDPDGGVLRYHASQLPQWLSFDPTTLIFSGTPTTPGAFEITVTVADQFDLYAQDMFTVTIDPYGGVITGTEGNDTMVGTPVADMLYGLAGSDRLSGGDDNDVLDGGTGSDDMRGGLGDDTYFIDDTGDTVTEGMNAGTDIVQSVVSYTLGQNIENLLLTAGFTVSGTGNGLNNTLTGNDTGNMLSGQAGNDILHGHAGNDTLQGGSGNDQLGGSEGDDTYLFAFGDGEDILFESTGRDRIVFGSDITADDLNLYQYQGDDGRYYLRVGYGTADDRIIIQDGVLGRIESYEFADGTVLSHGQLMQRYNLPLEANGSEEADTLYGSEYVDTLLGFGSNDELLGNGDDDLLNGGNGDDTLIGGDGNDTLTGGSGNDALVGGVGDDAYMLHWGMGRDTVVDTDGLNALQLDAGVGFSDLFARRQDNDLTVSFRGSNDGITLKDYYLTTPAWSINTSAGASKTLTDFIAESNPDSTATVESVMARYRNEVRGQYLAYLAGSGYSYASDNVWQKDTVSISSQQIGNVLYTYTDTTHATATYLETTVAGDDPTLSRQSPPFASNWRVISESGGLSSGADANRGADSTPPGAKFYPAGTSIGSIPLSSPFDLFLPSYDPVTNVLLGFWLYPAVIEIPRTRRSVGVRRDIEESQTLTLERIEGGVSDNAITTRGYSIVDGGDGDDTLVSEYFYGLSGSYPYGPVPFYVGSLLYGGAGNDALRAQVTGQQGDFLFGGFASLHSFVQGTDDLLIGGDGDDALDGGYGADTYLLLRDDRGIDLITDTGMYGFENSGLDMATPVLDWYYSLFGYGYDWRDRSDELEFPVSPLFPANDYTVLVSLQQAGLIETDTVEFGEGIALADLMFSWGQRTSIFGFEATTLDISWGMDAGVRIEIPPTFLQYHESLETAWSASRIYLGRAGLGIEQFKFFDGTTLSMLDMLRRAPAPTTFDPFGTDNIMTGTVAAEELYGGAGDDALYGLDGNDVLIGYTGNDVVYGGTGADTLTGGAGNDLLDGGEGMDVMFGGIGDDVYVIDDAGDLIDLTPLLLGPRGVGGGGTPTFDPGHDTVRSHVSYALGDSLEDIVLLDGALEGTGNAGNNGVTGSDGDNFLFGLDGDDTLIGSGGSDYMEGGSGYDTYVFALGDGIDTIQDGFWSGEVSRVQFGPGITLTNLRSERDGADVVIHVGSSNDSVRLLNFDPDASNNTVVVEFADGSQITVADIPAGPIVTEGDDTLVFGSQSDIIDALGGSDTVNGGAGNDVIAGGTGNDTLNGDIGSDTYVFNLGDGTDIVTDIAAGDTNIVSFGAGIDPGSLSLGLGSLLIHYGSQGDAIHVTEFDPDNVLSLPSIGEFHFSDGTVLTYQQLINLGFDLTGTDIDDVITGTNATDRITGGLGNDALTGGEGDDTYYYTFGDGNDTILDTAGADTLALSGVILPDLNTSASGDDLVLELPDGNTITIQDWFVGTDNQIETVFLDGVSYGGNFIEAWGHAPISVASVPDISADEDSPLNLDISTYFTDVDLNRGDVLTYNATLGGGSELPTWLSFGANTGSFTCIPLQADVGSLDIEITATDSVGRFVSETFSLTINNVNDAPIVANSILDQSNDEDSTFSFTLPATTFSDEDSVLGDTLTLSASLVDGSVLPDWLMFDATTDTFSGIPDNWAVGTYEVQVTATDTAGTSVSDVFSLAVQNTNDAPVLANPIPDQLATEGLAFNYVLPGDTFSDDDTLHGDVLAYEATLSDGSVLPSWLIFDAATQTFTGTASPDSVLIGTDGDDALVDTDIGISGAWDIQITATDTAGISAADSFTLTLQGVAGNDTLNGGKGNDALNGGAGNDTYLYNPGDGLDQLTDREGEDNVALGTGLTFDNAIIRIDDNTAHLRFLDTDGNEGTEGIDITLNSDGSSPIESFTFEDGSTYTLNDLLIGTQTLYGTNKADTLIGNRNDDTIYAGKGGDSVYGRTGNDTLYGEKGKDYLYGEGGHDALFGDKGDDTLNGGAGDDLLDGGKGHNTLIGGKGNDTLILGKGEDTIRFNLGDGWDTLTSTAKDPEDSELHLGPGITHQNLWFSRTGNDLTLNVLGTQDGMTIASWFTAKHKPLDEIHTDTGELEAKQIERLVQAMASFTPAPGSGTPLPTEMPNELQATLAGAWEIEH